jgi:hypothetical protein
MATASASEVAAGHVESWRAKCAIHVMQDNASCQEYFNLAETHSITLHSSNIVGNALSVPTREAF